MRNKNILYQEVSDSIKSEIISGGYPLNTYIPTESELEEKYQVSKITIRKAIQILSNEGYVLKKSGKGTEVISNRPFNILSKGNSYTSILEQRGKKVEKKILAVKELTDYRNLEFVYPRLIEITRLYVIDEQPAIYFKYVVAVKKETDITQLKADSTFSLYAFLAQNSVDIDYIQDNFVVCAVDEELKTVLNPDKPFLLQRRRESFNARGERVEYTESYYDTDKDEYTIDYQV